jgi:PPOX class probable F420-dependent enzyme
MARQFIQMTKPEWRAFLAEERTAVLASTSPNGFPHLAAMWYLPKDDGMLMWTYAKSQKALNLRRDPRTSALIEAGERYDELRGVLIQGEARIIDEYDAVLDAGIELHARYSGNSDGDQPQDALRREAGKRLLIRLPYERVISWDHRKLRGP